MTEYKQTLNLPQTDFPIRANLQNVEAEFTAFWAKEDIYHKIQEQRSKIQDQKTYILHDGPPYPNGDIHLGHALNKILKDIIVKYKSMSGFFAPYVPGWDCHGLPIETQLIKSIGDKRLEMDITEFREKCKEYALNYVDLQRTEFKRLGIFGEWDKPYLTINHSYEEKIVELFGVLAEKGYIYRGLKPIHWCPHCETALAEAEIEYEDDRSPSIHVKFEILNPKSEIIDKFKIQNPNLLNELTWNFIIWTTTPWTLPANVAIAANPEYDYVFLKTADQIYIIAEGLMEDFIKRLDLKDTQVVGKVKGKELEGLKAKHPFVEREVPLVLDRYVTLEQGTGLVHIAPGHGEEDYKVGLNYKLPIVMPVNEQGHFDDTVPEFIRGMFYVKANKVIGEHMQANGSLLKLEFFKHPYPHCWRCKKPVIFRATEQWFVAVDHNNMRQEALKAIKELVAKEGTNAWFVKEVKDILPADTKCSCGGTEFTKEKDILDVWFESGSSHAAVLETTPDLQWPADLYLEGSDQHRGWFQTSLLLGIGYKGHAPFKAVLTHGFTTDDKGKKMSKSLGNVISPQDVVKEYGADILRLWVASTDFRNDMAASQNILRQVREAYLKIRNTCRFLLSNLSFTPSVPPAAGHLPLSKGENEVELLEIDKWILLKLNRLIERVTKAYDDFEFHVVYHSLYDFCVNDLSAFYLDMSKDRLYCDGKESESRKSAQYAMREILMTLIGLMAPVLSFTAEDIKRYIMSNAQCPISNDGSVFLMSFPKVDKKYLDEKLEA